MNDFPRQKLIEIIARYGQAICEDPRHLELLLRDTCNGYKLEVTVLLIALREGLPSRMSIKLEPHQVAGLTKQLSEDTGMASEPAQWAVETWLLAIGGNAHLQSTDGKVVVSPPSITKRHMLHGHDGRIERVRFSADSRLLSSSGHDRTSRLWDVESARELWRLEDAGNTVYSRDFRLAASCGTDRQIFIWDTRSGQAHRLDGQSESPNSAFMIFSPDGRLLLGSDNQQIRLWDISSGKIYRQQSCNKRATLLSISPDSRLIWLGISDDVRLWDVHSDELIWRWRGDALSSRIGQNWRKIIYWDNSPSTRALRFWDLVLREEDRALPCEFPLFGAVRTEFSSDGQLFAVGAFTGGQAWDLTTGRELWRCEDTVKALSFSPDARILAYVQDDGIVQLWDIEARHTLAQFNGDLGRVWNLTFSPDGRLLLASGNDNAALWHIPDKTQLLSPTLASDRNFSFNEDWSLLASWDDQGAIALWSITDTIDTAMSPLNIAPVSSPDFQPPPLVRSHNEFEQAALESSFQMFWRSAQCCELCGTRLGTADVHVGRTRCVRHLTSTHIVVPAPTVELLQSYKIEGSSITSVALSPNGQIIGYTSYNAVQFLQASDGRLLHNMTLYQEKARDIYDDEPDPLWAECLAWSPDGRTVACGTRGGDLWLFGSDDGKIIWKGEANEGVTSIAYSPNSTMIAFGDWSGCVIVCRVDNGRIIREFDAQAGKISGLSWSPDSQQLASASWDDDVIVWRIDDGDQLHQLQGHSPYPEHVAWSSDGLFIATCDLRSIRIWSYNGQELRVFRQGDHHARQLAWRSDSRTLVSAPADSFSSQYPLQLWHLVADHTVAQLQGHTAFVTGAAWSADGQLLASSGADRTILLWRVR